VNLAYRGFCGLSIEDKIPDHSAFSRARRERFRHSDMFRRMFERVVEACIAAGLGGGEPSPPFSTLPSTLDDRSVGFSRRRGGGTATNASQGAMRVSGLQPDAAVSSRPDAHVAHFDEGQQPRNDDSSIIEPIELESA
jgi:Transposase domain (DUF772)